MDKDENNSSSENNLNSDETKAKQDIQSSGDDTNVPASDNTSDTNNDNNCSSSDDDNEPEKQEPKTVGEAFKMGLMETIDTFKAFVHAPREIIGINIINIFEGMAYFGVLTLLMLFMTKNVLVTDAPYVDIKTLDISQFRACLRSENMGGCVDVHAGWVVSGFLMLITFSQLFLGGLSDKLGPKKMLGISIFVLLISRCVMGTAELFFASSGTGLGSTFFFVVVGCLLLAALAYGVFNPAIYSLTRMYSDKKTSAVSYAMIYAGMNLGAFLIGLLLPHIRRLSGDQTNELGDIIPGLIPGTNGYSGALIFIAGLMFIIFALYFILIARSKTKPVCDPNEKEEDSTDDKEAQNLTLWERIKRHPLADGKFDFFIFILIPVQTLFAYQNILIPTYLERSFGEYPTIADNFETFSNINPLIVFIAAPIIAALTAKQNVYKMMIIGTTVMALPTFLLCFGQTPTLFLTFIFIGAIGESMWQPRFLQHVTQIAPKDRMGAYVGIANLPWFMTKFIVGLYVGFFIQGYIPDLTTTPNATQDPQTMWFIFACIAMVSPIALFIARKWMNPKQDDHTPETTSAA